MVRLGGWAPDFTPSDPSGLVGCYEGGNLSSSISGSERPEAVDNLVLAQLSLAFSEFTCSGKVRRRFGLLGDLVV